MGDNTYINWYNTAYPAPMEKELIRNHIVTRIRDYKLSERQLDPNLMLAKTITQVD